MSHFTHPSPLSSSSKFRPMLTIMLRRVGRVVKTHDDPSSTSPLDLPEDLELVTERSEPKPSQTDLDLGLVDYVTRFGAVGGALPAGLKCTAATVKVTVSGTTFYSFWKRTK